MFILYKCGGEFDIELQLSDFDVSSMQHIVIKAVVDQELDPYITELVAYMAAVMDGRQRGWFDVEHWPLRAFEDGGFGEANALSGRSSEAAIVVEAGSETV